MYLRFCWRVKRKSGTTMQCEHASTWRLSQWCKQEACFARVTRTWLAANHISVTSSEWARCSKGIAWGSELGSWCQTVILRTDLSIPPSFSWYTVKRSTVCGKISKLGKSEKQHFKQWTNGHFAKTDLQERPYQQQYMQVNSLRKMSFTHRQDSRCPWARLLAHHFKIANFIPSFPDMFRLAPGPPELKTIWPIIEHPNNVTYILIWI